MGNSNHIREIIERVVSASLATHVTALKDDLVEQACQQLATAVPESAAGLGPGAAAPPTPRGGAPTDLLNAAVSSVLDSTSQTDILTALLEGSSKFAERSALFVIRGGNATGWRGTGLEPRDEIKSVTLNLNQGLASRAYHDRVSASASAAEFDSGFVASFGAPADGTNALVLPLVLRDKVAALVYADAGTNPGGKLDPSALECLVKCSGLWLEIVAARKATPAAAAEPDPDTEKIPRYAEPAEHAAEPPPQRTEPSAPPEPPMAAPEPAFSPASVAAAAAPAPATAQSGLSSEEQEIHKKAKRFAKLLVDEIKLYNQGKVVEGRSSKDLYARLKDDIDKSRATYDKRYGATAAASGNYFTQELIRILANDDPSLLGDGFSG
jgi:hypothetical protein